MSKNNIIVYTVLIGPYDNLHTPTFIDNNVDYVCFTDQSIESNIYKIIQINKDEISFRRTARKLKILSHRYTSDYKYSIYFDANMVLKFTLAEINKYLHDNTYAVFSHPFRNCIYEEAEACKNANKDDGNIDSQMNKYKELGYPEKNGLVSSGFLIRDNQSHEVQNLNESWWNEVKNGSDRDQLSFNYAVWTTGLSYTIIPGYVFDNDLFYVSKHKEKYILE